MIRHLPFSVALLCVAVEHGNDGASQQRIPPLTDAQLLRTARAYVHSDGRGTSGGELAPLLIALVHRHARYPDNFVSSASAGLLHDIAERDGQALRFNVPELTELIGRTRGQARCRIISTLGALEARSESAVAPLRRIVQERSEENYAEFYAARAAGALARILPTPDFGMDALCENLTDARPHVRWLAAHELEKLASAAEPAVPKLRPLLTDSHVTVRIFAARAIRNATGEPNVAVLVDAIQRPESRVYLEPIEAPSTWHPSSRLFAIAALGEIGPDLTDDGIAALRENLQSDSWILRRATAQALQKVGPPAHSTADVLIATIRSDDVRAVRTAAADALHSIFRPSD